MRSFVKTTYKKYGKNTVIDEIRIEHIRKFPGIIMQFIQLSEVRLLLMALKEEEKRQRKEKAWGFVSGFFTLPDGSKYPIVEKNVTESIDWLEMPEDSEEKQKNWVKDKSKEKDYLLYTDVAKDVQDIIAGGPVPTHIKPIWPFIAFTAFHTLPSEFKKIYGIKTSKFKKGLKKNKKREKPFRNR